MMYKLLEQDNDSGYFYVHTHWLSKKDAEELRDHHAKTFPDIVWIIEPHDEGDEPYEEKHYNENACDGWEDMFPEH